MNFPSVKRKTCVVKNVVRVCFLLRINNKKKEKHEYPHANQQRMKKPEVCGEGKKLTGKSVEMWLSTRVINIS